MLFPTTTTGWTIQALSTRTTTWTKTETTALETRRMEAWILTSSGPCPYLRRPTGDQGIIIGSESISTASLILRTRKTPIMTH